MSKSQSSNVDCRCDGAEMSIRDQREGTGLSDRVEGSVSLEYIHSVETNLYTFCNERSDELGGMAVNKLFQVVCI